VGKLRPYNRNPGTPHQGDRLMADAASTPTKFSRTALSGQDKPQCRVIIPPVEGGWSEPALFEWELSAESWTDEHPHSEYNFVIEGQLFVESGGLTVEAQAGDVVRVPAGAAGRYWAPRYARLLAIYGPSRGGVSRSLGYKKLSSRSG
jgi:mannose-6-phosphate isomerase-like protein (cupin superfamily)